MMYAAKRINGNYVIESDRGNYIISDDLYRIILRRDNKKISNAEIDYLMRQYPKKIKLVKNINNMTSDELLATKEVIIESNNANKIIKGKKKKVNRNKSSNLKSFVIQSVGAVALVGLLASGVGKYSGKKNSNSTDDTSTRIEIETNTDNDKNSIISSNYDFSKDTAINNNNDNEQINYDKLEFNDEFNNTTSRICTPLIVDYTGGDEEAVNNVLKSKDMYDEVSEIVGIDSRILMAKDAQESNGIHSINPNTPAIGGAQIELSQHLGEVITIRNMKTNKIEKYCIVAPTIEDKVKFNAPKYLDLKKKYGDKVIYLNIEKKYDNLLAGGLILKQYIENYKLNNIKEALISYNIGPNALSRIKDIPGNFDTNLYEYCTLHKWGDPDYWKKVSNNIIAINEKTGNNSPLCVSVYEEKNCVLYTTHCEKSKAIAMAK